MSFSSEWRKAPTTYQELVKLIVAAGCTVDDTVSGHPVVRRPNGSVVMAIPLTARNPRGYKNAWARFRKQVDRPPRPPKDIDPG